MKTSNFFRQIGIVLAGVAFVLSTSFSIDRPGSCRELHARILHNPKGDARVIVVRAKELPFHLKHGDRIINMFFTYDPDCDRK